ncbi:MFS transporter [Acidipropionibacterium jensenii]|uniref:Major Facilitator Superfamily n=1 Tax=Acidipropionibacterium jensenii TaxID=1749 RepID=A0A3S4WY52_9ACTN|nr:MFS transporter [Acidipropionibacterium jensenii]MDN5977241.1 MFS transporter [Acidipropionibacterium jensenii]MDN5997498.1 MFS transporter [Acidipropionibacterium jensenii]MDN6426484.1 MFS transporter [Acidipropionibacterium jensenii]MDN6440684.1 MFS transporter [Acidipropionibacterium jensenii]MDN6481352.1 MFS transporter [Acidipropionibacterium jensenii]
MAAIRYRTLFSYSGATFVAVGFAARLPLAMSQLGTMLLVSSPMVAGRMGPGGIAAGAVALANAIGSPLFGGLTDRRGQRGLMILQAMAGGIALIVEAVVAVIGAPWPVVAAIGAVAGFFMPQIGTMARVRWRQIAAARPAQRAGILETSFAWEGSGDEASFALGPALTGVLAVALGPVWAIVVAGVMLLVFGTWFAVHPTVRLVKATARAASARSAAAGSSSGPTRERLFTPGVLAATLGLLMIGVIFGSVQTGTTTLATAAGRPGLAGLLHAVLSIGSATAGLLLPRLAHRVGLVGRWRVFATALAVLTLPLLAVNTLGGLLPELLVLGLAVAPYLITLYSVAERAARPSRIGAAMTVLAATTSLGYSLGASIAGQLADWGGHTPAYAVTVCAGAIACLLGWLVARRVTPAPRVHDPRKHPGRPTVVTD